MMITSKTSSGGQKGTGRLAKSLALSRGDEARRLQPPGPAFPRMGHELSNHFLSPPTKMLGLGLLSFCCDPQSLELCPAHDRSSTICSKNEWGLRYLLELHAKNVWAP